MNKIKKIINYILHDNNIYKVIEEIEIIKYFKPKNILISNINRINENEIEIERDYMKYCINDVLNNLTIDIKIQIIKQIYNCINNLHKLNINHGNIKLTNILLDDYYNVYICDYSINKLKKNYIQNVDDDYNNINCIIKLILKDVNTEIINNNIIDNPIYLKNNITLLIYNQVKINYLLNIIINLDSNDELIDYCNTIEYLWQNKLYEEEIKSKIEEMIISKEKSQEKRILKRKILLEYLDNKKSITISIYFIN